MRTTLIIVMGFLCVADCLLRAQGTIQFGFEDYPIGSLPPFVTRESAFGTFVASGTAWRGRAPFEGQKLLLGSGRIRIEVPEGQSIQSFTVHLFVEPFYGA